MRKTLYLATLAIATVPAKGWDMAATVPVKLVDPNATVPAEFNVPVDPHATQPTRSWSSSPSPAAQPQHARTSDTLGKALAP